jgi:hypothetical protein
MTPSLSRRLTRGNWTAAKRRSPRRRWLQPVLNATVLAVLVGPWIFATWSLIDGVLDRF